MRRAAGVLRIALLPTLALGVVVLVVPSRAALAVHVWLLTLLALFGLAVLGRLATAFPARPAVFDVARPSATDAPRFTSLERLEREVALASASAHDLHFRLRPTLREAAAELLAARRGIMLDRQPERARRALGDETWELVRSDRPAPADPHAPGLDRAALERVTTALEAV